MDGDAKTLSFKITNSGTLDLNLGSAPSVTLSGADAADFSVIGQPANPILAAGGSGDIFLEFNPSSVGIKTAQVDFATDDPTSPTFSFTVQGEGAPFLSPGEFLVAASDDQTSSGQNTRDPAIAHNDTDSEYLIVWSADSTTAPLVVDELEIWGQRKNAVTGAPIGGRIRISSQGPDGNSSFCLLYTSPSPRDATLSRMPSSA